MTNFNPPQREIDPDEMEVRQWAKENRLTLQKYETSEMFLMAKACLPWIDDKVIYRVLSHFRDALQGSDINNRAYFKTWLLDETVQSLKPFNLREQWQELADYQPGFSFTKDKWLA